MRLIDADALKLSHCKECTLYPNNCLGDDCDWESIAHINMMQTVDAVPVVRCKDCKYCDAMTIFGKTTLYSCTRKNPAVDVLPNDYCSRGRRIDES